MSAWLQMDCRDSERLWCVTRRWRRCSPNYWRLKRLCAVAEGRRGGGEAWGGMGRGLGLSLSRQEGKHRPQALSQQISPPSRLLFGSSSRWRIANWTTGRRHSWQAKWERFSDLLVGKPSVIYVKLEEQQYINTITNAALWLLSIFIYIYMERGGVWAPSRH